MTQNSPNDPTRPQDGDDLFEALVQANPVSDRELPSASSPEAQNLLNAVMSQPTLKDVSIMSTNNPHDEQESAAQPPNLRPAAAVAPLAPVTDAPLFDTSSPLAASGSRRGRGLLVAAAAAVVLVALAALTLVPINTTSAAAEIASAAAATDAARSGRIDTTFSLAGSEVYEDGESEELSVAGSVEMLYRGDDLQLSVALDDLPFDDAGGDELMSAVDDIRLVDGVVYAKPDGEWLAFDTNGMLEGVLDEAIFDQIDPREVLTNLQDLAEATEVGSATLDGALEGLDVTHFQAVVDLDDESVASTGWTPFDEVNEDVAGEITIDTYVDEDGLMRRVVVTGDIEDPAEASNTAVFEIETDFIDLGDDVIIEAPEGAVEFGTGLMGDLLEEGSA